MKHMEITISVTDEGDILITTQKGLTKWHGAEYFGKFEDALDCLKVIFKEFIKYDYQK